MIAPWIFNHVWERAKVEAAVTIDQLAEENGDLRRRVALLEAFVRALRDVNADLDSRAYGQTTPGVPERCGD